MSIIVELSPPNLLLETIFSCTDICRDVVSIMTGYIQLKYIKINQWRELLTNSTYILPPYDVTSTSSSTDTISISSYYQVYFASVVYEESIDDGGYTHNLHHWNVIAEEINGTNTAKFIHLVFWCRFSTFGSPLSQYRCIRQIHLEKLLTNNNHNDSIQQKGVYMNPQIHIPVSIKQILEFQRLLCVDFQDLKCVVRTKRIDFFNKLEEEYSLRLSTAQKNDGICKWFGGQLYGQELNNNLSVLF